MIGNKISPSPGADPKITFAIGTPDARVFCGAQNEAAILSALPSPINRAISSTPPVASA